MWAAERDEKLKLREELSKSRSSLEARLVDLEHELHSIVDLCETRKSGAKAGHWTSLDEVQRRVHEAWHQLRRHLGLPDSAVNGNGITYGIRKELPPLVDSYKHYDDVYGVWQTGTGAKNGFLFEKTGKPTRLVLLDPRDKPLIERMAKEHHSTVEELTATIKAATDRARKAGVEVKWYAGYIPETISIINPALHDARAFVEFPTPGISTQERPHMIIERAKAEGLYLSYANKFEEYWAKSKKP